MTPGVSILSLLSHFFSNIYYLFIDDWNGKHVRLAFEVFHDIKKSIIHIWLICKLDLDLVKITQCVLHVVSEMLG
jgi:hypothetical protein